MALSHTISKISDIKNYTLGCRHEAVFTLVSAKTKSRFTFRVRRNRDRNNFLFADIMSGPENETDYQFIGVVRKNSRWGFQYSEKSVFSDDCPAIIAFDWFVERLNYNVDLNPYKISFYYSGTCSNCGRRLTVPESLERGLGPKCFEKSRARL